MILQLEIDHEEAGIIEPIELPAWDNPLRESLQRELAAEDLGVARCPACQGPLQLRCDRVGPHFACRCALTSALRRAA